MFSDEMLGAYLDGELEPEQRALVERHMEADAAVGERLRCLRRTDEVLRRALPQQATAPNDAVLAMLVSGAGAAAAPRFNRVFIQAAALAAACVMGVIAGQSLAPSGDELGLFALSPDIRRALDTMPSGERVHVASGEMAVGFSVRAESGELCRQYELRAGAETIESLACLETDGWQTRVQAIAQAESAESYTVAGSTSPVDAAIAAMGEVSVLDRDAERALIANRWR